MIKRIKWSKLCEQVNAKNALSAEVLSNLDTIDGLINEMTSDITTDLLFTLGRCVQEDFLDPDSNSSNKVWDDLHIYVSSFKETDSRFIYLLANKLREYIAFYEKVLTNEGVQRNLVYSKEYGNEGSSSSTDRGTDSVTPQNSNLYDSQHPESDTLFDQAIANYASSINKNKTSSTSSSSGSSDTTVTGVTWEESKKNIQMMFFNELKDYIMSIPERIYSWYSLETIPAPELCKLFLEYRKAIWDLVNE